ncbi:unnamed protein product, partial [Mesorhabditis belari]|uniref:Uncharacterized protein n=1 Tax=Mesorhabditis belari TaxID=2138241 RepID=A0AAF3FRD9_9BILA
MRFFLVLAILCALGFVSAQTDATDGEFLIVDIGTTADPYIEGSTGSIDTSRNEDTNGRKKRDLIEESGSTGAPLPNSQFCYNQAHCQVGEICCTHPYECPPGAFCPIFMSFGICAIECTEGEIPLGDDQTASTPQ